MAVRLPPAEHARQFLALVYPLYAAWVRFLLILENLLQPLKGSPFRAFVQPSVAVEAIVGERGLQRLSNPRTGVWQLAVYGRKS